MADAWAVLRGSGVPLGGPRPPTSTPLDPVALRDALADLAGQVLGDREAEPLFAWLRGFQKHWPTRFAAILGDEGTAALARLGARPTDPDRYLKLRRIAVSNLAAVL